ncbi:MAG TPA: hypothetical protein VND15_00445 [Candidatus Acidoferrales bacterium]|nr:hypothetical protein [Candidatus Acidoferrales bacterium]
MGISASKEPVVNSAAYYEAVRMSSDIFVLLASKRVVKDRELTLLNAGLQFIKDAKGSDKPLVKDAIAAIRLKMEDASAAAGKRRGQPELMDEAQKEMEHVVATRQTDPKLNIYSSILFKELFEYYSKMRRESEARGL